MAKHANVGKSPTKKIRRKGVHAKRQTSRLKQSKHYKKIYKAPLEQTPPFEFGNENG